jgi:anti-sigma B factor antagonist
MTFSIRVSSADAVTTVAVTGDLDIATSPELRDALLEVLSFPELDELVVDLRQVEFVDSTALGVLVGAHKRQVRSGRFVVLVNPEIRRVFALTGLEALLDLREG